MTISVTGVAPSEAFTRALDSLVEGRFASRLFAHDAQLWGEAAAAEAAVRLGWTDFHVHADGVLREATELAQRFRASGIDRIVLCGMGGSSLAPLVISPALTVLDSTHPDTVRAVLDGDLARTAVVVSSKSGGTVETLSHMRAFEAAFAGAGIDPAARIVVVTDPGSALAREAVETGNTCFLADPTVGGRFSALTAFGIVPTVLAGAEMHEIIAEARAVRDTLTLDSAQNPALVLAAAIAAGAPRQFILELHSDGSLPEEFGLWAEQLVAESTGKHGRGVLPIALPTGDPSTPAESCTPLSYGIPSAAAVEAGISVRAPLGAQLLLWQVATAALGRLLAVDPFDQPDVEAAKIASRESLGSDTTSPEPELAPIEVWERLRRASEDAGYLALQAYTDTTEPVLAEALRDLRLRLSADLGLPVSLGYGPRYLHSTGQFHKGGPLVGSFLQIVDRGTVNVAIPGEPAGFGELLEAQAAGDASVLRSRGREVITVHTQDALACVRALLEVRG